MCNMTGKMRKNAKKFWRFAGFEKYDKYNIMTSEVKVHMNRNNLNIIFFIGNMSHSGGTERVLSIVANGLAQRGYQVVIMSLWGSGETFFRIEEPVKLYWLEKEAPRAGIFKKIRLMTSFLNRENADFLVDVDIILGCYSFFLKQFRPHMHWISWEHFNYYYHFRKNHNLRRLIRRLVGRFTDQLVVLSEEDKGYYEKNLNLKCSITRIYNPNPYEDVKPKTTGEKVVFAAGRLTKVKGFDLLIKSWKLLEEKYPEWTVLVAGDGEEKEKLARKIKDAGLKHFYLIGSVAGIEQYYQKSEIFVLSSRDEGFGMVLLEAMDYSLPVVSYSCKAGPSEIVIDGENGFLVEPENIEMFAEKMDLLMADFEKRRQMGEKAKQSTQRFGKEHILDQWEALLQGMTS